MKLLHCGFVYYPAPDVVFTVASVEGWPRALFICHFWHSLKSGVDSRLWILDYGLYLLIFF